MIIPNKTTFYMYTDTLKKHRQDFLNLLNKLHNKYPHYTYSLNQIEDRNDLPILMQILMASKDRQTRVAQVNFELINHRYLKPIKAIIFHSGGDKIKTVTQAEQHYEHLKHIHFFNANTLEQMPAKKMFNIVLDKSPKTHRPQLKSELRIDDTAYYRIPNRWLSDYEIDERQSNMPDKVTAKNKNYDPKKHDKAHAKYIKLHLNRKGSFTNTYVTSNAKSYKIAKIYKKVLSKLSYIQWPKHSTVATYVLQLMIPDFRIILAKTRFNRRPAIYARRIGDVNMRIFDLDAILKKNNKPLLVTEDWTKGYHKVDNHKVLKHLINSAAVPKQEVLRNHSKVFKDMIPVHGNDGLNGIEFNHNSSGNNTPRNLVWTFLWNQNPQLRKYAYQLDCYLTYLPAIDRRTGEAMRPHKIIHIRNSKSAKRFRHRIEKQQKVNH